MAFTMHSHSGQFCPGHARDQLEEVILRAIELRMHTMALTEHMPRMNAEDLYPEEIIDGQTTSAAIRELHERHPQYLREALRLKAKYQDQINIVVGFEGEWIRPAYADLIGELLRDPNVDFFIGSVHHTHEIPIDYDRAMYEQARSVAGGSDERLFEDYYDAQFELLKSLRPRVVGHFDLIRLFSDDPNHDPRSWSRVWEKIVRNLNLINEQGGLLEINSSALRKGLKEPYPGRSICEYFHEINGRFTLSDDSHGVAQIGLNFPRAIQHIKSVGIKTLHYLSRDDSDPIHNQKPRLVVRDIDVRELVVVHHPST